MEVDNLIARHESQADAVLAFSDLANALFAEELDCLVVIDELHERCSRNQGHVRALQ